MPFNPGATGGFLSDKTSYLSITTHYGYRPEARKTHTPAATDTEWVGWEWEWEWEWEWAGWEWAGWQPSATTLPTRQEEKTNDAKAEKGTSVPARRLDLAKSEKTADAKAEKASSYGNTLTSSTYIYLLERSLSCLSFCV